MHPPCFIRISRSTSHRKMCTTTSFWTRPLCQSSTVRFPSRLHHRSSRSLAPSFESEVIYVLQRLLMLVDRPPSRYRSSSATGCLRLWHFRSWTCEARCPLWHRKRWSVVSENRPQILNLSPFFDWNVAADGFVYRVDVLSVLFQLLHTALYIYVSLRAATSLFFNHFHSCGGFLQRMGGSKVGFPSLLS